MFFNKIQIKNYKCFNSNEGFDLDLRVPNGEVGSGLNILVGENGSGKTSILEGINYLTENQLSVQNRLAINDFNSTSNKIEIIAETNESFTYEKLSVAPVNQTDEKNIYSAENTECNQIQFTAKLRTAKKRNRVLSEPVDVSQKVLSSTESDKSFYSDSLQPSKLDLNIFFFDKNRTRHLYKGTYKTTFERILDDLNWRFFKGYTKLEDKDKSELLNKVQEYFDTTSDIAQKGVGSKLMSNVKSFFEEESFEKVTIELLNQLWPFSNAKFGMPSNSDDGNYIELGSMGSGIEMIFSLFLLDLISEQSKGSILYLIDEPELHLHPIAQKKLFNWLLEKSKDKQIVISTHSPKFVSGEYIDCVVKVNKGVTFSVDKSKKQLEKKDHTSFFPMHRDLFFTDKVIFLEGADDLKGYTTFCNNNNLDSIPQHFMQIKGKGDVDFFEAVCKDFGIKHFFIVDQDFLFTGKGKSYWSRKDRQETIGALNKLYKDQDWDWHYDELMKFIQQDIANSQPEKKDIERVGKDQNVHKIKDRNIVVLSKGAIEDYLDKETWEPVDDNAKKELEAIFDYIKENL